MNVHKNARLTPFGRERLAKQVLERVLTPAAASAAAGVSLRTIYRLFEAQGVPSGWVSGLVDANGNFIARVPPRPRGSRASEPFLAAVKSADEGWYRGKTVDGLDTYTAFTVSRQTGWSVGFAIPTDLVYGPVRRAALIAVGGLLVVLALAMGLALWLSRRITRPMAQLAEAAG